MDRPWQNVETHKSIFAVGLIVDRAKKVAGLLCVANRKNPVDVVRGFSAEGQGAKDVVVIVAACNDPLKNRRIRRGAADAVFLHEALQFSRSQHASAEPVEPNTLAEASQFHQWIAVHCLTPLPSAVFRRLSQCIRERGIQASGLPRAAPQILPDSRSILQPSQDRVQVRIEKSLRDLGRKQKRLLSRSTNLGGAGDYRPLSPGREAARSFGLMTDDHEATAFRRANKQQYALLQGLGAHRITEILHRL